MTHGTVLVIGPAVREIELLTNRLTKEQFVVERREARASVYGWVAKHQPQAVLVSHHASKSFIQGVVSTLKRSKKTRHTPVILVTNDDVPETLKQVQGVGESFRLHQITLAEAVKRLFLAIKLSHLART